MTRWKTSHNFAATSSKYMEPFKKILVCLDQSDLDNDIINATNKICELSPREVTFINVIPDFQVPDEMKKAFPKLVENALNERKEEIREILKEKFVWPNADVVIKVVQGQPAKAIISYANKGNFDLIISGRKEESSGVLKSRLARRSDCSFMMISENSKFNLRRILVPIDFSENSKLALERAVVFAGLVPEEVEVFAQNIYTVPSGYHYTGKSYDEFAEVMRQNSEKEFKNFMKGVDHGDQEIKPIYSLNDNDEFVSDIRDQARTLNVDLIIIGAKGQTAASAIFIGSKAERIVQMKTDTNMLVERKKGEKSGFMDFIDEL